MDYTQALLGLLCISLIKWADLTDPDTILYARLAFAAGSLLTLLTMAYMYLRIRQANDTQQLVLTNAELNPQPAMAAMLGAPQPPDANKQTTMTHQEYDLTKLRAQLQTTLTSICITVALHAWKGFMPPLILQSVMGLSGLLKCELAAIHIWGRNPAKDKELRRPWKPKSAFAAFKDLKKEMAQTMNDGNKSQRKNKKQENRKKIK